MADASSEAHGATEQGTNPVPTPLKIERSPMTIQPAKIGFYIRVNSAEQVNATSLAKLQEDQLREVLNTQNSIGNFGKIKGIFADVGASARGLQRQKLQELLKAVRSGEVSLVMVTDISRLSRSVLDIYSLLNFMRTHGCRLLSISAMKASHSTWPEMKPSYLSTMIRNRLARRGLDD